MKANKLQILTVRKKVLTNFIKGIDYGKLTDTETVLTTSLFNL
ncbi:hypothetical protein ABID42_004750 [Arcicella rosea]